ncbi:MAG: hypothetical protein Q9M92_05765 [Enterobacterales bacterium]|nr:hypothetical protein [Enterobacterales bacterium]
MNLVGMQKREYYSPDDHTELTKAIAEQRPFEDIQKIVKQGADVNEENFAQHTPLHLLLYAFDGKELRTDNVKILNLFVENGLNVGKGELIDTDYTFVGYAAYQWQRSLEMCNNKTDLEQLNKRYSESIQILSNAGEDINEYHYQFNYELSDLIKGDCAQIIQCLVTCGLSIERLLFAGITPSKNYR